MTQELEITWARCLHEQVADKWRHVRKRGSRDEQEIKKQKKLYDAIVRLLQVFVLQ